MIGGSKNPNYHDPTQISMYIMGQGYSSQLGVQEMKNCHIVLRPEVARWNPLNKG